MSSPDTGRRIVGQEVDLAELGHDGIAQPLNLVWVGDVGRCFEDPIRAALRDSLQQINGSIQFLTGQVRHHDRHPCLGKPPAHCATDTESRAGDDGDIVGLNDRGCQHAATPRRLAPAGALEERHILVAGDTLRQCGTGGRLASSGSKSPAGPPPLDLALLSAWRANLR
jgi:hypothetical protein